MEQLTGIQFLEATVSTSRIILTDANDQYAIRGFELNVTDYLYQQENYDLKKVITKIN
jgi:two-component SAPR family response regulator